MLVRNVKTTLVVREKSGDFRIKKRKGKKAKWNSESDSTFLDI